MNENKYPAKAFFSQKMSPEELAKSNNHRKKFAELAELLETELPPSEYRCEAIDLLENASMYATKAFSHSDFKCGSTSR